MKFIILGALAGVVSSIKLSREPTPNDATDGGIHFRFDSLVLSYQVDQWDMRG